MQNPGILQGLILFAAIALANNFCFVLIYKVRLKLIDFRTDKKNIESFKYKITGLEGKLQDLEYDNKLKQDEILKLNQHIDAIYKTINQPDMEDHKIRAKISNMINNFNLMKDEKKVMEYDNIMVKEIYSKGSDFNSFIESKRAELAPYFIESEQQEEKGNHLRVYSTNQ